MATDFPKEGDDLKVSLRNSNFPQFDYDFAISIKESEPEIWGAGGNIRGNEAFEFWTKARDDRMTEGTVEWIREREAWAARHFKDGVQFEDGQTEPTLSNIGGVVAAMKWGVILEIGERKMKDTVLEMVKKLEGKKERGDDERVEHEEVEQMAESMDEDRDLSESARTALENKRDEHNDEVGDVESKRVTLPILEQVYNRGVGAYENNPESVRPNVQSAEQWALARVNSFLFAVKNERFQGGEHDRDLMPEGHPLRSDEERMEMDETQAYGMEDDRMDDDAERMEMGVDDDRPYPNEHAARITDPALYQEFRREVDAGGEGVDFIFGIMTDDGQRTSEVQSIRFDREMFTTQQAMDWLDEHEFVAIKFEEASEERDAHEEEERDAHEEERDEHDGEMPCPPATQDVALNTENRERAIEMFNYGPLNVDEPGDYWENIAEYWDTTEEAARQSRCANCVAFDISPRMKECMPGETSDDDGELGYCWMHHFKCHSARSCITWAKGGPIATNEISFDWQQNAFGDEEEMQPSEDMQTEREEHEERKANGQFLTRDAHSEFVDEAEGTVQLVVSTETPVERGFGQEVLSHAANAVDLEYLNSGRAPLLLDHSFEKQIGVIKSVELDQANRKIRATVKFGRNDEQSRAVFQDVADGIRQNVSIGYKVHEMEREDSDGSGTTYRVTKWEPLEVSMVAVGADVNAMVGRQIEVQQSEQAKAAEKIRALGEAYKMKGEAEQAIEGGMSIEDFRSKIKSKFGQDMKETKMSDIGLTTKEQRSYSLSKALFALANPGDRRAQEAAAFEFEVSGAASRSGSFVVPFEVAGPLQKRDLTTSTGDGVVGEQFREGDFIEALRNASSVMAAGATMLTGLEGEIKIPRQSAVTVATFLGAEGSTSANDDDPEFDAVTMSGKLLGITSSVTKQLLNTGSLDVENLIRNDLARSIATGMDLAALSGSGAAGNPTGLDNINGISTVDFASATPTFAEVVELESTIASNNALLGMPHYLMHPSVYGELKTVEKATNTAEFIVDRDGMINGYPVIRSKQATADRRRMYMGNFADLLVGQFGPGVEIIVDPFSNASTGIVKVTATVVMDVAVRHTESFVIAANNLE